MVEELNIEQGCKAFDKYFKTLSSIGYIDKQERYKALVYIFITSCYTTNVFPELNAKYRKEMFHILDCIYNNSCIFKTK